MSVSNLALNLENMLQKHLERSSDFCRAEMVKNTSFWVVFQVQKQCDRCWNLPKLTMSTNTPNRRKCWSTEDTCPWKQKSHHPWSF